MLHFVMCNRVTKWIFIKKDVSSGPTERNHSPYGTCTGLHSHFLCALTSCYLVHYEFSGGKGNVYPSIDTWDLPPFFLLCMIKVSYSPCRVAERVCSLSSWFSLVLFCASSIFSSTSARIPFHSYTALATASYNERYSVAIKVSVELFYVRPKSPLETPDHGRFH